MSAARALAALMLLCAICAPAYAQQGAQPPIERQMSPEQFKAAGLDKLSPAELASLNTWMNRTIDTETTKAAALAKDKVQSEARGFLTFGKTDPITSTINGEFGGFQRGRNYLLANGQEWEQVDDASLVGVRKTSPAVRITPSLMGNVWYLAIDGYNSRAKVRRVK